MPVDRCDPVMPRGAGRETVVVPVVGSSVVGFEDIPDDAVGRPLDPVARDRRAALVARRSPVQLDRRRAVGVGRQVAGRSRRPGVRRGAHRGRGPGPEAAGVPCPDPVVAGRAHREPRVPERRLARGLGRAPAYTAISGHLNLVGERAPGGRGRRVPVQVDDGGSGRDRREIEWYRRRPRAPCGDGHELRDTRAVGVYGSDPERSADNARRHRAHMAGRGGGLFRQPSPLSAVRGHVDLVAGDPAAAVPGRCVPGEGGDQAGYGCP